ncbi:MAG: cache domain-containing protein [Desulfobacterales bacterium]|nr:cache domain-containing protein [Desulfobacterales bacterium]
MPDPSSHSLAVKTLPVRIIVPVALTLVLFIMTIFLFIIPMLETYMMDGKREGVLHLTENAWSVLALYHDKEKQGELARPQAQQFAIAHLEHLRYGPENKDYFWINDNTPVMIMHPYRPDLVGKDIGDFEDPSGKKMFTQMVKTVKESGAGFVDYLWQWKEDSERIVPKISYVKGFEPWGWVIGTGIYVDDVKAEISAVTRKLSLTCLGIMGVVVALSAYIIWAAAMEQKARLAALEQSRLREKQLIQADKMTSLGILVAGVAHEINNPATSLMLNAPNLKKMFQSFTPLLDTHFADRPDSKICNMPYPEVRYRIDLMLSAIEDSSARIKGIISELKDFSRPAEGQVEKQQMDINQVVAKSVDLTHTVLKKITPNVTVTCAENLPTVTGDFQKLQQVIINLLVNAGQALENETQAIFVSTFINKDRSMIGIEVKDTGPGVSEQDLKKMTDPFFTTRRDDGGTGLGLSISEKIVNDHNGLLEFESELGKGLTARILLPCSDKYSI